MSLASDTDDGQEIRRRRKQMRKSEKIISQELNESLRSESMSAASSLMNLSIETIISDYEEAELEVEFSASAGKAFKHRINGTSDEASEADTIQRIRKSKINHLHTSHILTGRTLLLVLYCALNICKSNIQFSDLMRLVYEGHIKYYKCKIHLPDELMDHKIPLSFEKGHNYGLMTYQTIQRELCFFVKMIPDLSSSLQTPDLAKLAKRYIDEMNLPGDMKAYVERLIAFSPPKMTTGFYVKLVPNYEARAMGYVIFILKFLFGIDGYREKEMSRNASKVNDVIKILKLDEDFKPIFVYTNWMNFIEYRQFILEKYYYATMFKNNFSSNKPYLAFNSMVQMLNPDFRPSHMEQSLRPAENVNRRKHKEEIKMCCKDIATKLINKHAEAGNFNQMNEFSFQPSLTPLKENFSTILKNDKKRTINRDIAFVHFSHHSCETYLNPQKLVDAFALKKIKLNTKTSVFPTPYKFSKVFEDKNILSNPGVDYRIKFLMTEAEWLEDLKNRKKLEKNCLITERRKFNEQQKAKVLRERKSLRKAVDRCCGQNNTDNAEDEIEFDYPSMAKLLYEAEQSDSPTLTLVTPDYNMWSRCYMGKSVSGSNNGSDDDNMRKLPESYRWLLNLAASIIHQTPSDIFSEVLMVEKLYMKELLPVELMENVILKRDVNQKARE